MKAKILFVLTMLFVALSCDEDQLNKVNPNQLSTDTFYKSEEQVIASINAVYAGLQANNLYNREYFFLHDLLSDDCQSGGPQLEAVRQRVLNHVFDGSNKLVNDVWRGIFRMINRANQVIANVPDAEGTSDALKTRVIAEARFLRAWAYFEAVSLWGRVPVITEVITSPEGIGRSQSEDEVYSLIFSDLDFAAANLPLKSDYNATDLGRATQGAARALAARVHLFRGDHAAARPLLENVINSGQYALVDRFLDNFEEENENNDESIFEIQFSEEFGGGGAWSAQGNGIAEITFRGQEYGPTAWRNVIPSDALVAEFEAGDPRFEYTFFVLGDPFNNGESVLSETDVQGDFNKPSWQKYQVIYKRPSEDLSSGINFRSIRYADVLLMMAEVENELSGPVAALPYLNQTRARDDVNMPLYPTVEYPTATQDEMFQAIVHERRVELAAEQIRNRDIRRWRRQGKLNLIGGEPIAAFESRHDLLPIPFQEIDNNSAMTNSDQNPGY